jgi:hypothetical protein
MTMGFGVTVRFVCGVLDKNMERGEDWRFAVLKVQARRMPGRSYAGEGRML